MLRILKFLPRSYASAVPPWVDTRGSSERRREYMENCMIERETHTALKSRFDVVTKEHLGPSFHFRTHPASPSHLRLIVRVPV